MCDEPEMGTTVTHILRCMQLLACVCVCVWRTAAPLGATFGFQRGVLSLLHYADKHTHTHTHTVHMCT